MPMERRRVNRFLFVLALICSLWICANYPSYSLYYRKVHYDPLAAKEGFGTLYGRNHECEEMGFLIIGDWGMSSGMQKLIAHQMESHAERIKAQFILSNGDNIYSWGAGSPNDPRFLQTFELPFSRNKIFDQMPWYMALGNHDRRGNIDSQIQYSQQNPRWVLPSSYYNFSIPAFSHLDIPPIEVIVLDTLPLVCSDMAVEETEYAINRVECEAFFYSKMARDLAGKDGMLGMEIYKQIHQALTLERREQLEYVGENLFQRIKCFLRWLKQVLQDGNREALRIVVGHHAMESASLVHGPRPLLNADLRPILAENGVDLYICGHDHNLQHIHKWYEHMHHIVSGGGGFVTGDNSLHPVYTPSEYPGLLFGAPTFGFVAAIASPDSLNLEFVDYWGDIIYNTTISNFSSEVQKNKLFPFVSNNNNFPRKQMP